MSNRPKLRAARGSGIKVDATRRAHAPLQPATAGRHEWVVLAMFRVADPSAERFDLDTENLVTIEGPGCYQCERPYSPQVVTQPCRGEDE